jgi:hypothetical protein
MLNAALSASTLPFDKLKAANMVERLGATSLPSGLSKGGAEDSCSAKHRFWDTR